MSNKSQGRLASNILAEDPNDRFFSVSNSAGTVNNKQFYKDIREKGTNKPLEEVFIISVGLANGKYEMMLTGQYAVGYNFYRSERFFAYKDGDIYWF